MSGGVNHVYVENCSYSGNVIYGIYLKGNLDRGGEVSEIYVRNIEFDSTESAILIDSYYKEEGSCCPPLFKNIFIENVSCKSTRDFGISLIGSEKQPLENISIKDVTIEKPEKPAKIIHVKNLNIENVKLNGADFKY
jgi:polygalacturonase